MPGPMPKNPATRARRNKSTSRAMLPYESRPIVSRPRLPNCPNEGNWHKLATRFWDDVWSSPMRYEFLRGDLPALLRLVSLVDQYWKSGELDVAREIRLLEREFGLTPLSRRRLEWQVTQTEEAQDRHIQRCMKRSKVVDGDPREGLVG